MNPVETNGWVDDLQDVCVQFQLDLSCMVDNELDDAPARRAISHLEECPMCREFFDDIRDQIQAHRLLANPDELIKRYGFLAGEGESEELQTAELLHRLATIFYQLGKAYVLTEIGPNFRRQELEKPVPVDSTRTRGRGFIDGVLTSGRGLRGGVDWREARHMLNGRLSEIQSPAEKGVRLLKECLAIDPEHEEARFYLAYLDARSGKRIRAATAFRQLFRSAVNEVNRAAAAVQLAKLHEREEEYKKAVACCRWVVGSGLCDTEERFFFVRFNIGMYYAHLGEVERSLTAFQEAIESHPQSLPAIRRLFFNAPCLHAAIERQPGFGEELVERCPELFDGPGSESVLAGGTEENLQ